MKTSVTFTLCLTLVILVSMIFPCNAVPITIEKGWNFISIPVTHSEQGSFIFNIAMNVDTSSHSIFKYNSATGQWMVVSLNTPLSPQDGFWIYSTEKKEFSIPGDNALQYPYSTQLQTGWNAIGFAGSPYPANQAFSSLSNNWLYAFSWNGVNQKYETTIFNGDQSSNTPIIPGKGYWIYMTGPALFYFPQSIPTTTITTTIPTTIPTSIPGTAPFPTVTIVFPTPTPTPTPWPHQTVTFSPPTTKPTPTPLPFPTGYRPTYPI